MSAENPHSGQGMVVLDIGGDVGALVVATPPSLDGHEIEICPAGRRQSPPDEGGDWWQGDWHAASHAHTHSHPHAHPHSAAWPHVGVLSRPTVNGLAFAAVFPGLRAGAYELWLRPDAESALVVTIVGGEVATADWPA